MSVIRRLLPLLLLSFVLGCSSTGSADLILHPAGSRKEFSQKFKQSLACHNEDGTFEFLLVADDADQARKNSPGQPLRPTGATPLRQVLYIKIAWLPMRGNIAETSVSNASFSWYILSDSPEHQDEMLKYTGAGYALARTNDKTIDLTVRSARLKLTAKRGSLTDPLGTFDLTGFATGRRDINRLHDLLAATRSRE